MKHLNRWCCVGCGKAIPPYHDTCGKLKCRAIFREIELANMVDMGRE